MKTREYIKNNWLKSIRKVDEIEYLFTSPCVNGNFYYLYYWDTYFINVGLLLDDYVNLAKSNILAMKSLIDKLGYMPNSSSPYMFNRTQFPLFIKMCDDYYNHTKDIKFIKEIYQTMETEYNFWMTNRVTNNGLNRYFHNADERYLLDFSKYFCERLKYDEIKEDLNLGINALAECESGYDFSPRFNKECQNYNPIDLNYLLLENERILDKYSKLLNLDRDYNVKFNQRLNKLKEIFLNNLTDYNYINNTYSNIYTVASVIPFVFKFINDNNKLLEIYNKLNFKYGIAVSEKFNNDTYQWAYPNMWPNLAYFMFLALYNNNLLNEAKSVAKRYVEVIDDNFNRTNCLWEKYDVNTGLKANVNEYNETEMLGWTAGVYVYFSEMIKMNKW